jgi:hypothetical protein
VYDYPVGPAPGVSGTTLTVLDGKLQVQTAEGARMSCERLTILVSGVEPADVTVFGKLVKITSAKDVKDGTILQASAQTVKRSGAEGATLGLEGDAKLVYVRGGKKIEVSTDLLSVNLLTGQVISEMELKPVTPILPPAPLATTPQPGPARSPSIAP